MPRGVWTDSSIAKRQAAARKAAATRKRRIAVCGIGDGATRARLRAECDATRGREAHKVLAGAAIPALIEKLREKARGTSPVPRGTSEEH